MVTLNFELHLYKGQTGVTGATGATGATGLVQQELQELLAESVIITQTIMVTLNFELHLYKGQTGVTGATGATGATGLVQQVQQELQELLAEIVIITQTIMVTFTFKLHLYKVQAGVLCCRTGLTGVTGVTGIQKCYQKLHVIMTLHL